MTTDVYQIANRGFMLLFVIFLAVASYYLYRMHSYSIVAPENSLSLTSVDLSFAVSSVNADELSLHERPLFWQSRRPHVTTAPIEILEEIPAPVVPINTEDPFKDFTLTGILAGDDFKGIFYRLAQQTGRLALGELLVGDWFLSEVDSTRVVFVKNSGDINLVESREFELEHVFPSGRPAPLRSANRQERQVIVPSNDDLEPVIPDNQPDQQSADNDSDAG